MPSAVFRGSIEFEDFWFMFYIFFDFLAFWCHSVTLWHTVTHVGCHTCVICHTCHKRQWHISLVKKCVKGDLWVTDFNKVWGEGWRGGQKVIPWPLADYFVVGRRQKCLPKQILFLECTLVLTYMFSYLWDPALTFPCCCCCFCCCCS
jgi:hypothetical protein